MGHKDFLENYRAPVPSRVIPHPIAEGIDGWRRMIDKAPSNRVKALFALMSLQGMRVSEARLLRPTDIDMQQRVISVRGKGDKTRIIPLTSETFDVIYVAMIEAWSNGTTIVNMSDSAARAQVRTCARKAGLANRVSSHQGRATFATSMLDNGANVREVQEYLGHASLNSTQVYTGVSMDSMRERASFR